MITCNLLMFNDNVHGMYSTKIVYKFQLYNIVMNMMIEIIDYLIYTVILII